MTCGWPDPCGARRQRSDPSRIIPPDPKPVMQVVSADGLIASHSASSSRARTGAYASSKTESQSASNQINWRVVGKPIRQFFRHALEPRYGRLGLFDGPRLDFFGG